MVEITDYFSSQKIVTVEGVSRLAAAFPDLVALTIVLSNVRIHTDASFILEHSAKLMYLEVGGMVKAMAEEILTSACDYCPNLHTLNVIDGCNTCPELINAVVQRCTKLRKLILCDDVEFELSDELVRQRVAVLKGKHVQLADWAELSVL